MADTSYIANEKTFPRTQDERRGAGARIKAFFSAVGHGLVAMGENTTRYRRLQALSALSDEELAKRGLKRESLVHYVFADVYYA